jgi:hypothetical protein
MNILALLYNNGTVFDDGTAWTTLDNKEMYTSYILLEKRGA